MFWQRTFSTASALATVAFALAACNAIVGNDDGVLVPPVGIGPGGSSGHGGAAGPGGAGGVAGSSGSTITSGAGGAGGSTITSGAGGTSGSGGIAGTGSGGTTNVGGSGGADASAGSGGSGGKGGASGSGGTVVQPDASCVADTRDSAPIKKDIIVLFDTSSSMSCDTADQGCPINPTGATSGMSRIGAVRNAITDFVSTPASAEIGVGLEAFPPADPLAAQCSNNYSQLDVPIAAAKDNTMNFATVLGLLTPHLNTPTEQALTGTYTAAKTYMAANPGRSVAIVLVTDGMPFACNNDQTGAVSAGLAKAAFEGSPSIETYVVGLANTATLDAVALAGTGGATHYIAANADATQKILDLLKAVSTMNTCDYTIPTNGNPLDYSLVNVQAKVGATGTFQKIYNVRDASACAAAKGGWFYDVNAPGMPTKISLCATETCDALKAAQGSAVQVLVGCTTMVATIY